MTTILVTGGTGTFGNAFAQRVLDYNLADRLIVLSRDEKKQLDMRARFDDPRLRFYLGDVRDYRRLRRAFQGVNVIVHSAALKQVDRSSLDILEFIDTNVIGTRNVIEACHDEGVEKLIVLSTDKAVASATPYGATKSLCEALAIAGNIYGSCRVACVRYGNIIGSRGSVLEIWDKQVATTGVLKITDERMTRFWLPIDDAVDLVLLALDRTGGGEIFIPKGVARRRVIELAMVHFPGAEIAVTGKRSYEKMHEVLVSPDEIDRLHDCGDCYVLAPLHVRWEPGPWGLDYPLVPDYFEYRSDVV
jgi:UDP-N-acetylglucosamine 4,6-dehydratase